MMELTPKQRERESLRCETEASSEIILVLFFASRKEGHEKGGASGTNERK